MGVTEVFRIIFKVFSCRIQKFSYLCLVDVAETFTVTHIRQAFFTHIQTTRCESVNSLASLSGLSGSLTYQFCEGWRS